MSRPRPFQTTIGFRGLNAILIEIIVELDPICVCDGNRAFGFKCREERILRHKSIHIAIVASQSVVILADNGNRMNHLVAYKNILGVYPFALVLPHNIHGVFGRDFQGLVGTAAEKREHGTVIGVLQHFLDSFGLSLEPVNLGLVFLASLDLFRSIRRINNRLGFHALIDILGRIVEYLQHGNNSIGLSVGSSDVRT